ncbi:MAG: PhoU domain-containing protein [Thermoplasmatota archaeon]
METRKVQRTGKSTFIISLPKPWVNKIGINVGDIVGLIPLSDGTILIDPIIDNKQRPSVKQYTIKMEDEDTDKLSRRVIGSYLAGYDKIKIEPKEKFTGRMIRATRRLRKNMIGLEVISENDGSIVMKDFLDSSDFSINKGVKRMYSVTYNMFLKVRDSFGQKDTTSLENLIEKDEEVDKLHWMICKQYNKLLDDVYFAEKMGMEPKEALGFLLTSNHLERIADHVAKIAHNAIELRDEDEIPISKDVLSTADEVIELFNLSIDGLFRRNFEMVDEVMKRSDDLEHRIDEIKHELVSIVEDQNILVSIAYIVDSLFRILSYSKDIAEVAIDHIIVTE